MAKVLTFDYERDDGEVVEVTIPQRWEICGECEGEGKHAHAIDGNGITGSEWADWDDDERENYLGGRYDQRCDECRGSGKIKVVDEESLKAMEEKYPGLNEQVESDYQAKAEIDAEREAERRYMGY